MFIPKSAFSPTTLIPTTHYSCCSNSLILRQLIIPTANTSDSASVFIVWVNFSPNDRLRSRQIIFVVVRLDSDYSSHTRHVSGCFWVDTLTYLKFLVFIYRSGYFICLLLSTADSNVVIWCSSPRFCLKSLGYLLFTISKISSLSYQGTDINLSAFDNTTFPLWS